MIRRALDGLYAASAGFAALCLVGIFAVMIAQVVLRESHVFFAGADDLSAYLCVATAFFAQAHTFRRGEMIRVNLLVRRVPRRFRAKAEALVLILAAIMVGYITWWVAQDALFSLEIDELAQGTVPFKLWIPKLAMPLGSGILLIAILDELVGALRGDIPGYVLAAEERTARGDYSAEV